jgi:hypothetical protein
MSKKIALWIIGLVFVLSMVIIYATSDEEKINFPTQSESGLQKNELISNELSERLYELPGIKKVSSISAVFTSEGWLEKEYTIEFIFADGKKLIGKSSILTEYAEGLPKKFRADRLTNDYLQFFVLTDGEEYKIHPSRSYFRNFSDIVKFAYFDAANDDIIKAEWEEGIKRVNADRDREAQRKPVL